MDSFYVCVCGGLVSFRVGRSGRFDDDAEHSNHFLLAAVARPVAAAVAHSPLAFFTSLLLLFFIPSSCVCSWLLEGGRVWRCWLCATAMIPVSDNKDERPTGSREQEEEEVKIRETIVILNTKPSFYDLVLFYFFYPRVLLPQTAIIARRRRRRWSVF